MKPTVIPRPDHTISRKMIDPEALKVMYRLLRSDRRAFLVGGAVRDLLLGRTPKDFDVGTDAHPHQVKRLFRNCRLVGRRFRLAHVHFGENIIEVSTFRRRSEYQADRDGDRMIRSDNTFGTPEEDALRRDFTINGLFYDLETFSVLDYVGGIQDLNDRVIRSIGDPNQRIPEDPLRILRAIKFAARLDFTIEPKLWKAMRRFAPDIHKCAVARVLEEIYRLLRGGAAGPSFQLMEECGILHQLLPELASHLTVLRKESRDGDRVFWQYLDALDELVKGGRIPTNPILLGALAVHLLGMAPGQEMGEEGSRDRSRDIDRLTRLWVSRLGVARKDRERLAHMLRSQPRFTRPRGRRFRPRTFVTKHYYPDSEELFALGVRATGLELEALERWQALHEEFRPETSRSRAPEGQRRRRRRPRGASRVGETASVKTGGGKQPGSRRRRRAKKG